MTLIWFELLLAYAPLGTSTSFPRADQSNLLNRKHSSNLANNPNNPDSSNSEIHLLDSSGTVLHIATNNHSQIVPGAASATTSGAEAEESGWIAFAYWYNSEATAIIDSFTTSWEVPAVSAENHNQTVFLFNALQPVGSASILQPVGFL